MLILCLATLQFLRSIQAATYLYVRERANYVDARRLCQKHGLDLAKVTSDEDQHNLSELIKKQRSRFAWLGVQYNGKSFDYSDGTQLSFANWAKGGSIEPDNVNTDRCVVIRSPQSVWYTRPCKQLYPSLCGPYQPYDACKEKVTSLIRWRQEVEFTSHPTHAAPEAALRSCAKDCAKLTCMYFTLDKRCKTYNDDTYLDTRPRK